jgi:hypothetical protein
MSRSMPTTEDTTLTPMNNDVSMMDLDFQVSGGEIDFTFSQFVMPCFIGGEGRLSSDCGIYCHRPNSKHI